MNDAFYDQTNNHFVTVTYAYFDLEARELGDRLDPTDFGRSNRNLQRRRHRG